MLKYLESLTLPTEEQEDGYILDVGNPNMSMTVYDADNVYPFRLFDTRVEDPFTFSNITVFCGGNGSGKSTLLNVIAEGLSLERVSPFNSTHHFASYVSMCRLRLTYGRKVPAGSAIVTSDDVFDALIARREENDVIGARRRELMDEYHRERDLRQNVTLRSLSDEDMADFDRKRDANRKTRSRYVAPRLGDFERRGNSNGEEAFRYFTEKLSGSALYLLDEPENSLSPRRQLELVRFIEDAVRFYDCQFVIATHSPLISSVGGALIYDLDESPVTQKKWRDLDGVRTYFDFFREREDEFVE